MERGWDATGRLEALWHRVGGRDKLAGITGISPTTLSGYNTGKKPLGMKNAPRIAEALGVTVYDLGAPPAVPKDPERDLLALVEEVRDRLQRIEQLLGAQDPSEPPGGIRSLHAATP